MVRQERLYDGSRRREMLIYASLWLLVLLYPFFTELVELSRGAGFSMGHVARWWGGMLPFILLFWIHNNLLVPRFFIKGDYRRYTLWISVFLLLFVACQYFSFETRMTHLGHRIEWRIPDQMEGLRRPPYRPVFPMPVLMNSMIAALMLGFNLAIVLLFKSQREQEDMKVLENMQLQNELKYLKSQINPHFFMNMLNNIHAMVEIDPLKAQDMILELSKLMRYVLYEGRNSRTTFANEVNFLSAYVALMHQRYPSGKVEVRLEVPESPSSDIYIPPLLFVSFVENAFKHGVSYRKKTRIDIELEHRETDIRFICWNTRPSKLIEGPMEQRGVGLDNVKRRLDLLFGDRYDLTIDDAEEHYGVTLIIPCL